MRWLGRTTIAAIAACAALAAPASADTLDQQHTVALNDPANGGMPVGDTRGPVFGNVRAGQTFTAGIAGALDHVDVPVGRSVSAGDLTMEIRDVTAGAPGALLATATMPAGGVPMVGYGWVTFRLSAPVPSVAGKQYAIVLSGGGCEGSSGCFFWAGTRSETPADPYPGGRPWFAVDNGAWDTWGNRLVELAFKTYVRPAAPAAPDLVAASDSGAYATDNVTNATDPVFALGAAPEGCTIELLINGEVVETTNGAVTGLAEGTYDVTSRANCGALGTSDESAAMSPKLVIDRTAPSATIDSGPTGEYTPSPGDLRPLTRPVTDDPTPTFTFSADESAPFTCRVDDGAFDACGSPHTTPALAEGEHRFTVRVTDTAGNAGEVTKPFSVARRCPVLGIALPVLNLTICL